MEFMQVLSEKNVNIKKFNYRGFTNSKISVESDGMMIGEVIGTGNDLILFQGRTIDELRDDFKNMIDFHYEK